MNDDVEKDDTKDGWISGVLEGGLPQILAGPAGKAISRLIGAGADIPAAWMEGIAQSVRDKTSARSQVTNAIAVKAAGMAVENPIVMDRALHGMLAKSYRTQTNREAVAKVAVEELKQLPPPNDGGEGPADDWMNKFERYAEDATSQDVRLMFGRLLAKEIRSPGKVSSATLRFVSDLDSDIAKLIERALPYCTVTGNAFLSLIQPELSFEECTQIGQSGFWTYDENMTLRLKPDSGTTARFVMRNGLGVRVEFNPDGGIILPSAMLSKVGKDFVSITESVFDIDKFSESVGALPGVGSVTREVCFLTPTGWKFLTFSPAKTPREN